MPHSWPISMLTSGMPATKIAAIAVPIRGVANDRPMSCPATVVAPTTARGRQSPNRRRRPVATEISSRIPLAASERRATAPTQPKARTTLRTSTNEQPQIRAMAM